MSKSSNGDAIYSLQGQWQSEKKRQEKHLLWLKKLTLYCIPLLWKEQCMNADAFIFFSFVPQFYNFKNDPKSDSSWNLLSLPSM